LDCLTDPDPDLTPSTHEFHAVYVIEVTKALPPPPPPPPAEPEPEEPIVVDPKYIITDPWPEDEDGEPVKHPTASQKKKPDEVLPYIPQIGVTFQGKHYIFPEYYLDEWMMTEDEGPIPKIEHILPDG